MLDFASLHVYCGRKEGNMSNPISAELVAEKIFSY